MEIVRDNSVHLYCVQCMKVYIRLHCVDFGKRAAVYRVSLIQSRGSSLVVTHHMADVRVTSDRPVTRGLVPVEISTSISDSHAAMYAVIACVS